MTHTLHRIGDERSLKRDYVIYGLSAQDAELLDRDYNRDTREAHRMFMEICFRYKPVNAGCIYPTENPYSKTLAKGNTWKEMESEMVPFTETLAVFDDAKKVESVVKDLKKADLGISVVVSGIFNDVFESCKQTRLTPHTVNVSLGIMGDEKLRPKGKKLDLVTMCGHGLVSRYLIEDLLSKISKGQITVAGAAKILGSQCICGAFNTKRAEEILSEILDERSV